MKGWVVLVGWPCSGRFTHINVSNVSNVVSDLTHGMAVDINGLSAEHLYYCHPALCVILSRLFQLMLMFSYVPVGFRHSYIVPIPKSSQCSNKALTCDEFRGIAISPIISKVFEHCILNRTDFSRCWLHLEANLVLRKALVAAMPFGWLAVLLITLYAAVTLPIYAPLTCQRHLTKSTITPYTLS